MNSSERTTSNQSTPSYHPRIIPDDTSPSNSIKRISFGDSLESSKTVATASKMNLLLGGFIQKIIGFNPFAARLNEQITININSLSKRLQIPKKEIIHALKSGQNLQDYLSLALEVQHEFEKIHQPSAATHLGIRPETLQSIVEATVRQIKSKQSSSPPTTEVSGEVEVKEGDITHKYMYSRDMTNRLIFIKTSSITQALGHGSFGAAYLVTTSLGSSYVYKKAEPKNPLNLQKAKRDVIHEYQLLREINPSHGEIEGIMHTPHAAYQISVNGADLDNFGYLTELYSCDASAISKVSSTDLEKVADGFRQLFKGLQFLHQSDISVIHGDIKPGNISIKDNQWRMIDFGGAKRYQNMTPDQLQEMHAQGNAIGVRTDRYLPPKLKTAIKAAAAQGNVEEYLRLQKLRDQFAMGYSFLEMIFRPQKINWNWRPDDFKNFLIKNGFSHNTATEITHLIMAGYQGTNYAKDLSEIFAREVTYQKQGLQSLQQNAINHLLDKDGQIFHGTQAVGSVLYQKLLLTDFEYRVQIKIGNKIKAILFTVDDSGFIKTRDGLEFDSIRSLEDYATIIMS